MKRSKQNLSCYKLASMDMGVMYPIHWQEVLPGDTIQQATSALIRITPQLAPVMHPTKVHIDHYFVPYRLIWDDWEDFITKGRDGLQAPAFPIAEFAVAPTVGSIGDFLGLPTGQALTVANGRAVSALPNRAYRLIWNEWYRDNQLIAPLSLDTTSGTDTTTWDLANVAWEKDPYTTIRPDPQLGPDITIPFDTTSTVVRNSNAPNWETYQAGTDTPGISTSALGTDGNDLRDHIGGAELSFDPMGGLTANLTPGSINELREAFAMQRWEEARNRWGSRYTEYLKYLGVQSADSRLQRPELLGRGKTTIQFSEVLATAETGTSVDVGDLKGHGIASMKSNRYRRHFTEHGVIMTMMYIRPKTMYVQGIPKQFLKTTPEEFWQKELQFIGDETVYNKQIYAADTGPNDVFGYWPRYEDYRHNISTVAGEFRSTLNYWHMARIFAGDVAINEDFIKCAPTTRIFASTANDPVYVMANHSIQARRLVAASGLESKVL